MVRIDHYGLREVEIETDRYKNGRLAVQWAPIQPITSMPSDPLAADWSERLNKFTAADLSSSAACERFPLQVSSQRAAAAADSIDDETHFCCETPELQWTGDPQFPGVACQNFGYIVADCGSVVMHRVSEQGGDDAAEPTGPAQQDLF